MRHIFGKCWGATRTKGGKNYLFRVLYFGKVDTDTSTMLRLGGDTWSNEHVHPQTFNRRRCTGPCIIIGHPHVNLSKEYRCQRSSNTLNSLANHTLACCYRSVAGCRDLNKQGARRRNPCLYRSPCKQLLVRLPSQSLLCISSIYTHVKPGSQIRALRRLLETVCSVCSRSRSCDSSLIGCRPF